MISTCCHWHSSRDASHRSHRCFHASHRCWSGNTHEIWHLAKEVWSSRICCSACWHGWWSLGLRGSWPPRRSGLLWWSLLLLWGTPLPPLSKLCIDRLLVILSEV